MSAMSRSSSMKSAARSPSCSSCSTLAGSRPMAPDSTGVGLLVVMTVLRSIAVGASGDAESGAGLRRRRLTAALLRLLLRPLLAHRLLALGRRRLRALGLFEETALLGLVLLDRHDLAVRIDRLALACQALLAGLRRLGARGRHLADDEKLLAHRPQVRHEPVDDDTEREEDTREDER